MLTGATVISIFCLYMGIMFGLALWTSNRRALGRSVVNNPLVYALSLAVYCSSWTFYGSVGLAVHSGILYLAIYLGPTLACLFLPRVIGKIIKLKTSLHITSIADFISARYGKSEPLAALVTVMAIVGITPYVALQLKAVFSSYSVITTHSGGSVDWVSSHVGPLVVAMMILFTIIFGVRRLDPTERHEGMVMAVAAESMVKLLAFLAVGGFVVYGVFDGVDDIFGRVAYAPLGSPAQEAQAQQPGLAQWICYILLAANAFLFLPRQFHIGVVEAKNAGALKWAMVLLPVYLLLINFFVQPVSQAGLLAGFNAEEADTFMLRLPLSHGETALALLVFIGGFSAATSMIMISSMTMSTMISNHLILPLVDWIPQLAAIERYLLKARWITVAGFILLGYLFERLVGQRFPLASMGMISFAATLQMAPAIVGGLYWRGGHSRGAMMGLTAGFAVWIYTLLLPALSGSSLIPQSFVQEGPLAITWLRPQAMFGLQDLDPISHTVIWSMIFNVGFYIAGSLWARANQESQVQGETFVEAMQEAPLYKGPQLKANIPVDAKLLKLEGLLRRYFDEGQIARMVGRALSATGLSGRSLVSITELAEFFDQVERFLAGVIGAATANRVFAQAQLFSVQEAEELRQVYAEMLAELRARPQDLKRKIDYYRERESLMQTHAEELSDKVVQLEAEIHKRHMAEAQLRESEERYRIAIEDSTDGVAVIQDGSMFFINRKLSEIFGYKRRRELVGKSMLVLVHPEEYNRVKELNQRRQETMPAPFRFDFKGIKKDGSPLYIAVSAAAHDYHGNVLDLVFMRDVTRRRKAEDNVRRLSRRLIEGIEEERRRLAADLHDELGQSLTGLHMQVESLKNAAAASNGRQNGEFEKIIKRIEQIADSVRSISTELRPDVLDHLGLVSTIEWYINEYQMRLPQVKVSFEAAGFKERKVSAQNEIALYRIVQEALNNIAKHAKASRIKVQLTYSHPLVILSIRDNGVGFVLEPDETVGEDPKGGIGLLSMQERVAAVGGSLDIRSAPGKGTRIRVNVPNQTESWDDTMGQGSNYLHKEAVE
jgi:PAS domain S-box-containing protein